jgi:hypothetical protein
MAQRPPSMSKTPQGGRARGKLRKWVHAGPAGNQLDCLGDLRISQRGQARRGCRGILGECGSQRLGEEQVGEPVHDGARARCAGSVLGGQQAERGCYPGNRLADHAADMDHRRQQPPQRLCAPRLECETPADHPGGRAVPAQACRAVAVGCGAREDLPEAGYRCAWAVANPGGVNLAGPAGVLSFRQVSWSSAQVPRASVLRTLGGTACYLAEMIGAIVLIAGHIAGLYLAAVAIVANFFFMISGSWLLLVGVSTDEANAGTR